MTLGALPGIAGPAGADGLRHSGERFEAPGEGRFFGRSYLGPSYFDGGYIGAPGGSIVPAAAAPVFGPDLGAGPRPCAPPPLLIKVGRGLAHPARTRVTYGVPACGY